MAGYKFDHAPLMAPGRHFTCLSDLEALCVAPFPRSKVRAELFAKLCAFVHAFHSADIPCEIYVNGSFVTAKDDPSDVDVAVIMAPDVTESLNDAQQNLVDAVNDDTYIFIDGVDSFVETLFPIGHPSFRANGNEVLWSEEYGKEHNGEYLKGIAVLRIGETDVGLRIRS